MLSPKPLPNDRNEETNARFLRAAVYETEWGLHAGVTIKLQKSYQALMKAKKSSLWDININQMSKHYEGV